MKKKESYVCMYGGGGVVCMCNKKKNDLLNFRSTPVVLYGRDL